MQKDLGVFRTEFAKTIFENKYAHKGCETWEKLSEKLIQNVCGDILPKGEVDELIKFHSEMKFIAGGRYLYYANRKNKFYNNCFLLKSEEDSREDWANLSWKAESCLMTGGGIGNDYSIYRPKGAPIRKTGGEACLTGDTIVYKDRKKSRDYNEITILDLYNYKQRFPKRFTTQPTLLRALNEKTGKLVRNTLLDVIDNGINDVFEVLTESGYKIKATDNHRFMNSAGEWQQLLEFNINDEIAVNGQDYEQSNICIDCGGKCNRRALRCIGCHNVHQKNDKCSDSTARQRKENLDYRKDFCEKCGKKNVRFETHHIDRNPKNNNHSNLITFCPKCHQRLHAKEDSFGKPYRHKYLSYDKIISIEWLGKERVFDLSMESPNHNFVANGFISHNSGPIPKMFMINEIGRNVMQGGSRRSAIYASLNWRHGDVSEFLHIKDWYNMPISGAYDNEGKNLTIGLLKEKDFNYPAPLDMTNVSVNYDNKFLETVYDLPIEKIEKKLDKNNNTEFKYIPITFIENCRQAMKSGEPGFSFNFFDKENETLRNACTEVTSEDDSDVCNLGSVNISRVESLEEFERIVYLAGKFLLCGTLKAQLPYKKIEEVREKNRRLGLGLMGIHEWLLARGYDYTVVDELKNWLEVYKTNSETGATELANKLNINIPVAFRALAPTGTIGIMAGTTTSGEPLFSAAYKRRYLKDGDSWHYQYVVDGTTKILVEKYNIDPDKIETALDLANNFEKRIAFQADIQDYVDMSISSTINLPPWGTELNNETKISKFAKTLLKYAHRLRGFTCYPDGSRGGQPLTRVPYAEALTQEGKEFKEEFHDICDISSKGGSCGV